MQQFFRTQLFHPTEETKTVKYTPSTLFHGIRNEMLRAAFEKAGINLGIDWEKRDQAKDKSVQKAWEAYDAKANNKEKACKKLQSAFYLAWDLGTAKNNATALCRQYELTGQLDNPLPPEFNDFKRFEIGIYLYLHEDFLILEQIAEHIGATDLGLNPRQWTEYSIEPVEVTDSDEVKRRLATVLDEFAINEKMGGDTQIESYPRLYEKLTYFIAKSDGQETSLECKFNRGEEFADHDYIPPYVVIFRYDSKAGRFSLHTPNISKSKTHKLAARLLVALTGKENEIKRLSKATYDMSKFAVKKYALPSMADCGYPRVYTEKLWIRSDAGQGMEFAIKDLNERDAYDTIAQNQNSAKLTAGKFSVSRIAIVMMPAEGSPAKKIRFEIAEKTCTQRDLKEEQIKLVETLVDRMDIEI